MAWYPRRRESPPGASHMTDEQEAHPAEAVEVDGAGRAGEVGPS